MSPSCLPRPGLVTVFPHHVPPPQLLNTTGFQPQFCERKNLKLQREEGAGITAAMAGGCSRELGWVAEGGHRGGGALRLCSPQDRFLELCLYPYFTRARNITTWRNVKLPTRHLYTTEHLLRWRVETPNTDFCSAVMSLLLMGLGNSGSSRAERVLCSTQKQMVSFFSRQRKPKEEWNKISIYICMYVCYVCKFVHTWF